MSVRWDGDGLMCESITWAGGGLMSDCRVECKMGWWWPHV